jgi:hypothetical protein
MAYRTRDMQEYHDRVIEIAAENLRNNFTVYTNPGNQRLTSVGNSQLYPDIILTLKMDNIIQYIIEVETIDSVTYTEVNQWKQFSAFGGVFYLMVPREVREKAENLCRTYGINSIKFATYWVDNFNNLQIDYE